MAPHLLGCLSSEEKQAAEGSEGVGSECVGAENQGEGAGETRRGHWSQEQNLRYHWFLEVHYGHFMNRHLRRMDKIFKSMEVFVGSRQAEQCRSHHQKMEKKHNSFTNIIAALRRNHYRTLDPEPLAHALADHNVALIDPLPSAQELTQPQPHAKPLPRLRKAAGRGKRVAESEEEGKAVGVGTGGTVGAGEVGVVDMLEEWNPRVGALDLYLELDHSCQLFNSMFS